MFTTDLNSFEIQHQELRRRADHYRLLKSLRGEQPRSGRMARILGQLMVDLGQQLVAYAQGAH